MSDDILKRAKAGDPEAQAEMAYNCLSGPTASGDLEVAMGWLRLAAEGGNAWAQTEYAIKLRSTKDPEKQIESVHWLRLACDQVYPQRSIYAGVTAVPRGGHRDRSKRCHGEYDHGILGRRS